MGSRTHAEAHRPPVRSEIASQASTAERTQGLPRVLQLAPGQQWRPLAPAATCRYTSHDGHAPTAQRCSRDEQWWLLGTRTRCELCCDRSSATESRPPARYL